MFLVTIEFDIMELDVLDKKILRIISCNAKTPFLEIARECGVSGAAIHQRVQKLTNSGIIQGSEYVLDTHKLGYQTCAFLGVVLKDLSYFEEVVTQIKLIPEVVECHYAIGKYAMFIKVYAKNNKHLLQIILEQIGTIKGILTTETFQVSLDEIFKRQILIQP